ncbi:maleylpyruvate isomerase N-terminal domain-containing protein [Streptomyces bohaiensis]|uniref:maleylpyruvate isomerase N-terminal domain-containing protein n=1 Tax=Streptomyces bohaiensis TaxID=1431344 RepID=UPI003B7FEC65
MEQLGHECLAHVLADALAVSARALRPHADEDWDRPAGSLTWSCRETAAHLAHDLAAYAGQVAGLPDDRYLAFDLVVPTATGPAEVLRVVDACGALLLAALARSSPQDRAWHWGPCDPAGFAAMGTAETLLHTWDITRTLEPGWEPPSELSAAVLRRLFPEAPTGAGDPTAVLLWCTGRGELPGRAPRTSWAWQAARPE